MFYATSVQVVTTGNEVIAVTRSGMFYYFGDYNSGAIHAEGFDEDGDPITLDVPINSASLVEQFLYKYDPNADPWYATPGPDVDLVFRAELALGGSTLHFLLVVKNGEVVFPRTP